MTGIEDWALLAEKIEIYWYSVACDGSSYFCFKSGKLDTPENISKKYFQLKVVVNMEVYWYLKFVVIM